jgi:rhamnogalacturonyl hydrolase YesR
MKKFMLCALLYAMFSGISFAGHFNLTKEEVVPAMQKVADWQIANFTYSATGGALHLHDYGISAWTNATLFLGMSRWAGITTNNKYINWLMNIGQTTQWKVPENLKGYSQYGLYHADELAIIQFYEAIYQRNKQPQVLQSARERLDYIIQNPAPNSSMSSGNKQQWSWCDALFMAPPAFIGLWQITGDERYLNFADQHFKKTYQHLYNLSEQLFYRDESFFGRKEANGKDIFWGRGNGWVAAGLANILKILPQEHDMRPFYESLFCEHVARLASLQNASGFWHASLLDPGSYPAPETSATAMITFALAYGVNSGLLPASEYAPVVKKAWNAMLTAIHSDGKLGWIQPIGADPQKVTADMTAVYGVGAFLMAGSEILSDSIITEIKINRGAGIISITPETGYATLGSTYQATFSINPIYTNPRLTGTGEDKASITNNVITITNVDSGMVLTLSATLGNTAIQQKKENQLSVEIYPNPVKSGETLTIAASVETGIFKIIGLQGEQLTQRSFSKGTTTVRMNYPAGVYFLQIAAKENEATHKIIVQ